MYLEISGRGTGKTYRLTQAVIRYLNEFPDNIANVIVGTERQAKYIKSNIEKEIGTGAANSRTRFTNPDQKIWIARGYGNVRNFLDDFDYWGLTVKKNDPFFFGDSFKDDYYVTTPAEIRDLSKNAMMELAKTDFLMRLLVANEGLYCSYLPPIVDGSWLNPLKEAAFKDGRMTQEQFSMEFEARFFKL